MSQTTYLEAVVTWDENTCRENLKEALPKLITYLQEGETSSFQDKIGILKILCQSFLPCLSTGLAEDQLFSNIIDKACGLFDRIIFAIQDQVAGEQKIEYLQQEVGALLYFLIDLLDCMEACTRFIQASKDPFQLCHFHSLNQGTIYMLKATYGHCKESEKLYGDLMASLTEPLSFLFKKAHSLQLSFLSLLDKVTVENCASEIDVQDLCLICHGLFAVCQIVSSLDVKLVINLWKTISKYCTKHKELLRRRLEVGNMILFLCEEIKSGYTYLFQLLPRTDLDELSLSQGDERAFQKSVKILGFQMKILVVLVREYVDDLDSGSEMQIHHLLLEFHKYLPPSLYAPPLAPKHVDEIRQQLINATEPLVISLLVNKQFHICLTVSDKDLEEELALPTLLLQLLVLDNLPRTNEITQAKWIAPVSHTEDIPILNIVAAVFTSVSKCFTELSLPVSLSGVMCSGKPQREVNLYEYVLVHLCGFIGSFPANHFNILEDSLLQNVLSKNPCTSALATDAWCFLARYGTAELCRQHVHVLLDLCNKLQNENGQLLWHPGPLKLLRRLIRFMAVEHQQELIKKYPISDYLWMWSELPASLFSPTVCRDMMDELCLCCVKQIHNFLNTNQKMSLHLSPLIISLNCLVGIYRYPEIVQKYVLPKTQAVTVENVCGLLFALTLEDWLSSSLATFCLGQVIQLHAHLIVALSNTDIFKIFTLISTLLKNDPCLYLRILAAWLLMCCGKVKIPPSFEQTQILNRLSECFSRLLSDSNPLVLHFTLEAFTKFAEETAHESVVPQCMEEHKDLQNVVVQYLNKVPCHPEAITDLQAYLKLQSNEILTTVKHGPQNAKPYTEITLSSDQTEPACKRKRTEKHPENEEELRKMMDSMDKQYEYFQTLSSQSSLPEWVEDRLKHHQKILRSLISDNGG